MPLTSSLIYLGVAKEVTQGTALAPTAFTPVDANLKDEDVTKWIEDKGLRGVPVDPIAQYAGPKSSTISADGMFYPDVPPNFLVALLGADTVTGTAAPYTHTITLKQAQPPSYTLSRYNGYNQRQYPGCMLDELALKWASDGAVTYTTKWLGYPSATATITAPAMGTSAPFLGWQAALTIGGSVNARLIGFDWTGKRKAEAQWPASNSQTPGFVYVGPLAVTGKLTFAIADDTELTYMLNDTQPAVVLTLTAPNAGPTLKIQMSQCAFSKYQPNYSKDYIEVDVDINAMPSAADAGAGAPISPVQFVLTNTQSTAY